MVKKLLMKMLENYAKSIDKTKKVWYNNKAVSDTARWSSG